MILFLISKLILDNGGCWPVKHGLFGEVLQGPVGVQAETMA